MGHLRVGRLPLTLRWKSVVSLLESSPNDLPTLAQAVVEAAQQRLRRMGDDFALTYCFWLLSRITWASRNSDFGKTLAELGIEIDHDASALTFVSLVNDHARSRIIQSSDTGPFGELATLALRRALTETVCEHSQSLFGSSVEDLQSACKVYSTRTQFGVLAKRFFADFLSRTLSYFIDKELSNHVGPGHSIADITESRLFSESLDVYARQSARIMEDFASGWYSKHNWESKGEISQDEARGFVAFALRKLRIQLEREGART